jgi:predicted transcriptional regulator
MTVGIVSLSAIEGIGAHRVHSSESVEETGVVVCPVSLAIVARGSLPRHRLYSQIEVGIPSTAD